MEASSFSFPQGSSAASLFTPLAPAGLKKLVSLVFWVLAAAPALAPRLPLEALAAHGIWIPQEGRCFRGDQSKCHRRPHTHTHSLSLCTCLQDFLLFFGDGDNTFLSIVANLIDKGGHWVPVSTTFAHAHQQTRMSHYDCVCLPLHGCPLFQEIRMDTR